jgi:hypothetical protein
VEQMASFGALEAIRLQKNGSTAKQVYRATLEVFDRSNTVHAGECTFPFQFLYCSELGCRMVMHYICPCFSLSLPIVAPPMEFGVFSPVLNYFANRRVKSDNVPSFSDEEMLLWEAFCPYSELSFGVNTFISRSVKTPGNTPDEKLHFSKRERVAKPPPDSVCTGCFELECQCACELRFVSQMECYYLYFYFVYCLCGLLFTQEDNGQVLG